MALRKKWRSGEPFLVHHVDSSIVVVEKKAGLLTQATEKNERNTLLHHIHEFLRGRGGTDVFPVHRLDRVVSGLLVYARTERAQHVLIEQFKTHDVQRLYTAAVQGVLEGDEGTFESHLITNHKSLRVFSGDPEDRGARHAVTHWRVRERFADATLVEVALETGIRNQIRVHFAEAGYPLLGERKYAPEGGLQKTNRIFLHAEFLGFDHPHTGRYVRFEAPLPRDLESWKRKLASVRA